MGSEQRVKDFLSSVYLLFRYSHVFGECAEADRGLHGNIGIISGEVNPAGPRSKFI
jgi:hypothetical protein